MSIARHLSLTALALAMSASASANVFDFYAESGPLFGDELLSAPTYTAGYLNMTVRAYLGSGAQAYVANRWDGLGVSSGTFLDAGEINSSSYNGLGDKLVLSFDKAVNLSALSFSMWENDYLFNNFDHAVLTWDTGSMELSNVNDNVLPVTTFSLKNITTKTLSIQAKGLLSSFRLAVVNAEIATAVPEMGSSAMFGLGLLSLGWLAYRRQLPVGSR